MLPLFDLNTAEGRAGLEERLQRLRASTCSTGEAAASVSKIIDEVRRHGDDALVRYMRKWTDPEFNAERIRVTAVELAKAEMALDPALREAIVTSIDHVRQYQEHIMPRAIEPVTIDGAEVGLRFTPVESLGLTIPGGAAVLFSTLFMLAVPAQVAGVDPGCICVVNPPPTRSEQGSPSDVSPLSLAVCKLLGIEKVYRIGGAQAVAALAFGTESVDPVDMIAGPGNVYVQLAQAQVSGFVGTDGGFYGPSEIVVLADETADPQCVAADLIAQAEHDPGKCFLVSWSADLLARVRDRIQLQLDQRRRRQAIVTALTQESCALLVQGPDQAAEACNRLAPEHLNLAVANPGDLLPKIRHAGQIFLGGATPVAAGDYYAGPSHTLPTGMTARFTSGISVYTFLRRSGTVAYHRGLSPRVIEHIARLAEAEGLDGHAASVRLREPGGGQGARDEGTYPKV